MCIYVSLYFLLLFYIYIFSLFLFFFSVIILHIMCIVIMLWAASIDGQLSSLVACHCTDLYLFNLFVHLANKLSLSLSLSGIRRRSGRTHLPERGILSHVLLGVEKQGFKRLVLNDEFFY